MPDFAGPFMTHIIDFWQDRVYCEQQQGDGTTRLNHLCGSMIIVLGGTMQRRSLHLLIAFAWLVSLTGCRGLPGRVPSKLELVGQYTYHDGQAEFTVLPGESSPYIVYHKEQIEPVGNKMTIRFSDVSIDVTPAPDILTRLGIRRSEPVTTTAEPLAKLPDNYRLERDVTAEEFVEGKWVEFSEFDAHVDSSVRIGIVVLVDSSKSIDRQLGLAKSAATYLADALARRWPASRVWQSVVLLDAAQYPYFTNDQEEIKRHISRIEAVPYTPLYDAVARACDAFDSFAPAHSDFKFDKRWLLLFTDGQDNYSENEELATLGRRLAQSDVSLYALGIQGLDALDESDLTTLASERFVRLSGLEREKLREVQAQVVDTIEQQSPALYDVVYERNDQTITQPRKIKLTFTIKQ